MPAINIREGRRAASPASKYDGTSSFDDYRTPVAYTADDLMRQLRKRAESSQTPEEDSGPSYFENLMAGAAPAMDTSIYDKYKPEREYSFADRLSLLKSAPPQSRAAILELTAPKMKKMKKGWSALGEALIPAAISGTTYANSKKAEHDALLRQVRKEARIEEVKEARKTEREYLKQLLKKESNIESHNLKSADKQRLAFLKMAQNLKIAKINAAAKKYIADKAYEGKKFCKAGAQGDNDLDNINKEIENTEELLNQTGSKGTQGIFSRIIPDKWRTLSPEQAAVEAQEHALKLKIAKYMGSNRNQVEFENTPSISGKNSVAANKAVVQQLRKNFNKGKSSASSTVKMIKNGAIYNIPANEAELAEKYNGFERIK